MFVAMFFLFPVMLLSCHVRGGDIDVRGNINAELDVAIPTEWTLLYENDGYPEANCGCASLLTPSCYAVFGVNEYDAMFFEGFASDSEEWHKKEFERYVDLMDKNDKSVPADYRPSFSDLYMWKQVAVSEKYFELLTMVYEPADGKLYIIAHR